MLNRKIQCFFLTPLVMMHNRLSGQCACHEGIGGQQCDQCARGYKGQVPYCEPCGECFTNWDATIQDLIAKTNEVLDQVNNIQAGLKKNHMVNIIK